jgi:hypothetical protein
LILAHFVSKASWFRDLAVIGLQRFAEFSRENPHGDAILIPLQTMKFRQKAISESPSPALLYGDFAPIFRRRIEEGISSTSAQAQIVQFAGERAYFKFCPAPRTFAVERKGELAVRIRLQAPSSPFDAQFQGRPQDSGAKRFGGRGVRRESPVHPELRDSGGVKFPTRQQGDFRSCETQKRGGLRQAAGAALVEMKRGLN